MIQWPVLLIGLVGAYILITYSLSAHTRRVYTVTDIAERYNKLRNKKVAVKCRYKDFLKDTNTLLIQDEVNNVLEIKIPEENEILINTLRMLKGSDTKLMINGIVKIDKTKLYIDAQEMYIWFHV